MIPGMKEMAMTVEMIPVKIMAILRAEVVVVVKATIEAKKMIIMVPGDIHNWARYHILMWTSCCGIGSDKTFLAAGNR